MRVQERIETHSTCYSDRSAPSCPSLRVSNSLYRTLILGPHNEEEHLRLRTQKCTTDRHYRILSQRGGLQNRSKDELSVPEGNPDWVLCTNQRLSVETSNMRVVKPVSVGTSSEGWIYLLSIARHRL